MLRTAAGLSAIGALGVNAEVYFKDTFSTMDAWKGSEWKPSNEMSPFELCPGKWTADETDLGMCTKEDARFYGASAEFPEFSNKGKDLIVQYEVKFDEDPECGGAYVKLGPKMDDQLKFGDPTPYYIMFGPDKCGYNKRTHLIFNYNGENVLKTSDIDWKQDDNEVSSLYRLTVKADGSVAVKIGKEDVYEGKVEDDWKLLPEKEIDDPDDKKPDDWVDEAMIDDPEDEKPSDWVEQEKIPDPEAKKPDDWDDEEDGDWEIPEIDNPEFKGPWKPKRISNPDYKGVWAAKRIPNPKYDASQAGSLHVYDKFAFIGFDLWQVKGGTHFDNMIITDDVNEADTLYEAWVKKSEYETETKKVEWSKTSTTTEAPEPGSADEDDIEADGDDEDL